MNDDTLFPLPQKQEDPPHVKATRYARQASSTLNQVAVEVAVMREWTYPPSDFVVRVNGHKGEAVVEVCVLHRRDRERLATALTARWHTTNVVREQDPRHELEHLKITTPNGVVVDLYGDPKP